MNWERSSWLGFQPAEEERLRYALIVPRLLAPHPNRGAEGTLRADQGLALAVQVRIGNLQGYTEELDGVPKFSGLEQSIDWTWRFVGAFVRRLIDETPDPLLSLTDEAPDPASRAAASVAAGCALLEFDRIDQALSLFEDALSANEYSVVDSTWLQVQHARLCLEIGRRDDSLADANQVRERLAEIEGDPTADAINATAASLRLSMTLRDSPESFEEALIAGDTVAAWWRTQTISIANEAIARQSFESWSRDRRVTVGGEDTANNRLLSAALMASHSGDQAGWANRIAGLGRDQLLRVDRRTDALEVSAALGELRRGGDDKSLKLAITHLVADGPALAVRSAASEIDLTRSNRTTGLADLTILQRGGDLLDSTTADETVFWLLATLVDPTDFARRISPSFLLELQLIETLVGVIAAADPVAQRAVIGHLSEMPPEEEQLLAQQWANLIWSIPVDTWTEQLARGAADGAERHHLLLKRALFGIAARRGGDKEARARLSEEAAAGSVGALGELGSVAALPSELAAAVIDGLVASVRERIDDAKGNRVAFGGRDPAEALAVMNFWHHDLAQWEPLIELLAANEVPAPHKRRTLNVLASSSNRLPIAVVQRLRPIVSALSEQVDGTRSPFEPPNDPRGPAIDLGLAIGAIDPERRGQMLLTWLAGDSDRRRWAAHFAYRLRRPEDSGLLATLVQDRDPDVRAAAAAALAAILPPSAGKDSFITQGLQEALRDPGVSVPRGIAEALRDARGHTDVASGIRSELRDHISAAVRSLANQESAGDSTEEGTFESDANPFLRRFRYKNDDPENEAKDNLAT